jgi:hypothetical protein
MRSGNFHCSRFCASSGLKPRFGETLCSAGSAFLFERSFVQLSAVSSGRCYSFFSFCETMSPEEILLDDNEP